MEGAAKIMESSYPHEGMTPSSQEFSITIFFIVEFL